MFSRLRNAIRRSRAVVAFHYDGNQVRVVKGRSTGAVTRELNRILSEHSAGDCEIHIIGNGRVEFEKITSRKVQQAVRNVLVE